MPRTTDAAKAKGASDFAGRVRKLRRSLGYNVSETARLAQIAYTTLDAWEKGKRIPHEGPAVRRLAEILNTTPGYLLDGDIE